MRRARQTASVEVVTLKTGGKCIMGKMKKILAAGVVCYAAYKLGQKYLKEKNVTAEDVFDSVKTKAEAFAKQAAGVVPTTKDEESEGKKVYTFGKEKRIGMVHLAEGVTGLYDNKKNYPIEKRVKSYSEDGGKLYVYSDAADYVITADPFFMNVYVKDKSQTEAIAIALGKRYDADEIAVYNYGSGQKFDAQGMAVKAEEERVAAEQAEAKAKEEELKAEAEAKANVEAKVEDAAEEVKEKAEDIAETIETTAEEVAEKAEEAAEKI